MTGGPVARVTPIGGDGRPPSQWTAQERYTWGRSLRKGAPRRTHEGWSPPADRPDPIALLEATNATRVPDLVPVRYGRMLVSPFAFLRGSAAVMASDLSTTSTAGILVQLCGDAHVANFGLFATPERRLVFDVTDFDETLPGPFEWDVKRLAVSLVVVARQAGLADKAARSTASSVVGAYRTAMARYARMGHLAVWYDRIGAAELESMVRSPSVRRTTVEGVRKARARTTLQAMERLTTVVHGVRHLVDDPPLLVHSEDDQDTSRAQGILDHYLSALTASCANLLSRYRFVDVAFKVVGIGSVGTRCFLAVGQGLDTDDVVLLQLKEADVSALEPYLGPSVYPSHGQRVVEGQRLMQVGSDLFLGWGTGPRRIDYYARQYRDMKGSFTVSGAKPSAVRAYGQLCGRALAQAHARSGQAPAIAGYLGTSGRFDQAVAEFALGYADQIVVDHTALVHAATTGRIRATTGE